MCPDKLEVGWCSGNFKLLAVGKLSVLLRQLSSNRDGYILSSNIIYISSCQHCFLFQLELAQKDSMQCGHFVNMHKLHIQKTMSSLHFYSTWNTFL